MAETLKITTEVVDSDLRDGIGFEDMPFKISDKIDGELVNKKTKIPSIDSIKSRKIGHIGFSTIYTPKDDKKAA